MTLRRLAGFIGFCWMLTASVLVVSLYLLLWMQGVSSATVYVNKFNEQTFELILFTLGQWLVPLTIYEIDELRRTDTQ